MSEHRHRCETCQTLTGDVYRIKRVHRKTKRLIKMWQCAKCYEDEVRRGSRDHNNELKGQR